MSSEHEIQEAKEFLTRHYHYEAAYAGNGEQDIHVFAVLEEPVFNLKDASKEKCYSIDFGVGPVSFTVKACIDIEKKKLSICVSAKVGPLHKELGCVEGSLTEGVVLKFNWYVVSGSLRFYVKDHWLWVHWDIKALGKHFEGDTKLIPLPGL